MNKLDQLEAAARNLSQPMNADYLQVEPATILDLCRLVREQHDQILTLLNYAQDIVELERIGLSQGYKNGAVQKSISSAWKTVRDFKAFMGEKL